MKKVRLLLSIVWALLSILLCVWAAGESDSAAACSENGNEAEFGQENRTAGTGHANQVTSCQVENGASEFVTRMYTEILGREPDEEGFEYWKNGLTDGSMTAADVISGFFHSAEYLVSSNSSDEQFVTECYGAILNRTPDESGMEHWKARKACGMTDEAILAGVVGSEEFAEIAETYGIQTGTIDLVHSRDQDYLQTSFVNRLYTGSLGRNADPEGLENWCDQLQKGAGAAQVSAGIILSDEAWKKHLSNGKYVDMLYSAVLGREADDIGRNEWTERLDESDTRENVLNGFVFSQEFTDRCETEGLWRGKAISEPDSTDEWQNNVQILKLVNRERAKEGRSPLATREDLWRDVCQVRAGEITMLWAHVRPNGASWATALDEAGFDYLYAGENIAYDYESPEGVFEAWMNSPGHRLNILRESFDDTAVYSFLFGGKMYWAQLFMKSKR